MCTFGVVGTVLLVIKYKFLRVKEKFRVYGTASPTSDFDLIAVTEDIDIPFIIKAVNPQEITEAPDKVDALYACSVKDYAC